MSTVVQITAFGEVLAGSISSLQHLLPQSFRPNTRYRVKTRLQSFKNRSSRPTSQDSLDVSRILADAPDLGHPVLSCKPPANPVRINDSVELFLSVSDFLPSRKVYRSLQNGRLKPLLLCSGTRVSLNLPAGSIHVEKRGFRTRSSGGGIGVTRERTEEKSLVERLSSAISQYRNMKHLEKSEKLKNILSEIDATEDQQKKVKLAFSEGYLAAKTGKEKESQIGRTLFRFFWVSVLLYLSIRILTADVRVKGGTSSFGNLFLGGSSNEVTPEEVTVTFEDVKGIEEAKDEVMEIVEYLKDPEKFSRLGGRLPKGILLVGPPGCGKTLLARAIAGEAGVPFFHASGSEFDEVLVGQGARRVRDLFAQAKNRAPAVIFIDEADSVGAKRVSTAIHPYANQTINQLLNEMDGFSKNEGIIVLAATNRRDDLDKALLRPGRFDVEVNIPIPDLKGRAEILILYLDKVVQSEDVDVQTLGKGIIHKLRDTCSQVTIMSGVYYNVPCIAPGGYDVLKQPFGRYKEKQPSLRKAATPYLKQPSQEIQNCTLILITSEKNPFCLF